MRMVHLHVLIYAFENHKYAFNDLDSDEKIDTFFKKFFLTSII